MRTRYKLSAPRRGGVCSLSLFLAFLFLSLLFPFFSLPPFLSFLYGDLWEKTVYGGHFTKRLKLINSRNIQKKPSALYLVRGSAYETPPDFPNSSKHLGRSENDLLNTRH